MVTKAYTPDRGDIVWVDLNPTQGHEQAKTRPALVISPKSYNARAGLMLACPITSLEKGYPFEVTVQGKKIKGAVLSDHLRSLDWRARAVRHIERSHPRVIREVTEKLLTLIVE
jgi:mRNA interferase MazF